MPQNRNKSSPPEVMTQSKKWLVVIVAALFDILRGFFTLFWFFGPALAGLYCTVKVNGVLTTYSLGLLGIKTAAALCAGGAITGGAAVSEFTTPFGVVMADAVGLAGFLVLGLWIVMTNARILKAVASAPLQFAGAFAVGEIPFLGAFPVFAVILWRLYGAQIRSEKAAFAKWEKENASAQLQQRNQVAAQVMQIQAAQQAQFMEQEAANEAVYAEAANDEQYEIPEDEKMAA
jgi:hypothetical protein